MSDSPIEQTYLEALERALDCFEWPLEIVREFPMGHFRYDFGILYERCVILLVECDGKAFHETPEQIENDLRKTRRAIENGLFLLRFRGRDIHNRVNLCVDDTLITLEMILLRREEQTRTEN